MRPLKRNLSTCEEKDLEYAGDSCSKHQVLFYGIGVIIFIIWGIVGLVIVSVQSLGNKQIIISGNITVESTSAPASVIPIAINVTDTANQIPSYRDVNENITNLIANTSESVRVPGHTFVDSLNESFMDKSISSSNITNDEYPENKPAPAVNSDLISNFTTSSDTTDLVNGTPLNVAKETDGSPINATNITPLKLLLVENRPETIKPIAPPSVQKDRQPKLYTKK